MLVSSRLEHLVTGYDIVMRHPISRLVNTFVADCPVWRKVRPVQQNTPGTCLSVQPRNLADVGAKTVKAAQRIGVKEYHHS